MRNNDAIFDVDSVVEYFDEQGFKKIPRDRLMDFIIARNGEKVFLDTWRDHFKSVRVPFALCKHMDEYSDRTVQRYTLWKERRI